MTEIEVHKKITYGISASYGHADVEVANLRTVNEAIDEAIVTAKMQMSDYDPDDEMHFHFEQIIHDLRLKRNENDTDPQTQ